MTQLLLVSSTKLTCIVFFLVCQALWVLDWNFQLLFMDGSHVIWPCSAIFRESLWKVTWLTKSAVVERDLLWIQWHLALPFMALKWFQEPRTRNKNIMEEKMLPLLLWLRHAKGEEMWTKKHGLKQIFISLNHKITGAEKCEDAIFRAGPRWHLKGRVFDLRTDKMREHQQLSGERVLLGSQVYVRCAQEIRWIWSTVREG